MFWSGLTLFLVGTVFLCLSIIRKRDLDRQVRNLSISLRRVAAGDYSLDVRDNIEGELSILRNEIYKVTSMLAEQSSLYRDHQQQLASAIADISHQLKTPLTSLSMMADLLAGHPDEEKKAEFVYNIQTQVKRMKWLLSSLLKLSKIDAGTAVFHKERIQVAQLIRKAAAPYEIAMEIKGIDFQLQGSEEVTFIGDENWSNEAMTNLLKNALEHVQEGGKICVRFTENSLYTEIIVSDNGKGIAKEDLPYIFKRFYRGKNAASESVGIGLAMVKSIVCEQNGSITVQSKEGAGTAFLLKFYKGIV